MTTCLRNIAQLATCPPNDDQADIGCIQQAALVWDDDRILWAGPENDLPAEYQQADTIDAGDRLVIPGLIDCHTHLCFGGWRGNEFEMRIQGRSYLEIAQSGGGIVGTVEATRSASSGSLLQRARTALEGMLQLGVVAVECKSGYGLDRDNEIKQLEVYRQLDSELRQTLVATYLGAHIIPPEYRDSRQDYIQFITGNMIPELANRSLAEFCDCYIDAGAYTVEEGREILSCARDHGLGLKIHAEQIEHTGAAALAAELGATSAEHLEHAGDSAIRAMAQAGTVAVTLPLASLYLREPYANARRMIEAGVPVAVATDFNPGSAPSYHLPFAMLLACLNQQMTPAEVLKGATTYAARAINREQELGSLIPGHAASFALIDAPDVNHWLYHTRANACVGTWINGERA